GIPSDPLREKSTAESLDEAPAVDPFAIGLGGQTTSLVFPVAAPTPEAADATTGEPGDDPVPDPDSVPNPDETAPAGERSHGSCRPDECLGHAPDAPLIVRADQRARKASRGRRSTAAAPAGGRVVSGSRGIRSQRHDGGDRPL